MTSAYLNRPTRMWADANLEYCAATSKFGEAARGALESAEKLSRIIKERTTDHDVTERADDLAQAVADMLEDYLEPLERALKEEYAAAERQDERAI